MGAPARPICNRFSKDIIDKLLDIAWWNWDIKVLKEHLKDFNDINTFIEKYHVNEQIQKINNNSLNYKEIDQGYNFPMVSQYNHKAVANYIY